MVLTKGLLKLPETPVSERHELKCSLSETLEVASVCTEEDESAYTEMLQTAVLSTDMDKVEQAIACGADVNTQNELGCSPLMTSVGVDTLDCRKSPVSIPDAYKFWRANYIFKYLLSEGALTHLQDVNGESVAHKIVAHNKSELLENLAKDGADLNIQDRFGMTPVMSAALKGSEKSIKALVNAKVDLTKKNVLGQTAYDLGEKLNPAVRSLLKPGSEQGLIIQGSADGKCSPLKINIVMSKPTKLILKASDKDMFLMVSKDLKIELMANAGETASQEVTINKMGTFKFQCGVHGGTQSNGTITIVH